MKKAPALPFCDHCSFTELVCHQCGVGFFERVNWDHYSPDEKAEVVSRAHQRITATASRDHRSPQFSLEPQQTTNT